MLIEVILDALENGPCSMCAGAPRAKGERLMGMELVSNRVM